MRVVCLLSRDFVGFLLRRANVVHRSAHLSRLDPSSSTGLLLFTSEGPVLIFGLDGRRVGVERARNGEFERRALGERLTRVRSIFLHRTIASMRTLFKLQGSKRFLFLPSSLHPSQRLTR